MAGTNVNTCIDSSMFLNSGLIEPGISIVFSGRAV